MQRQVDPQLVGGLSFVVPGAGLAYMGLWGWAVAAFITVVGLIRVIGLPTGHPVVAWLLLASLCSAASISFAKYHNERLMKQLLERVEMSPPPPPPPETSLPAPPEPLAPSATAAADAAGTVRFCPSCGTRNEGHRFCPQCGSSLQVAPT